MRTRTIRVLLPLLAVLAAPAFAADKARVVGSVIDREGAPIGGVEVTVRDLESGAEARDRSNSKGKFKLDVENASQPQAIRLYKKGYRVAEQKLEIEPGTTLEATWTLVSEEEAAAIAAEIAEVEGKNRAARMYNEAAKLYNEGDPDAALAGFAEALVEDEELAVAWAGIARIHLERGDFAEALEAAAALRRLSPEEPLAMQFEYDALWALGEKERAAATLEELIAAEPGRAPAARLFNQGVAAVEENRLDEAVAQFERAVEIDPSLFQAFLTLAQIHEARGEHERALERLTAYHAATEPDLRSQMVKYRALAGSGRGDEAKAVLGELAAEDAAQAAKSFLDEGGRHFDQGRSEEALAAFETALLLEPDRGRTHYMLGLTWASRGNNTKARAALQRFLELSPDDPEAPSAREMLQHLGG